MKNQTSSSMNTPLLWIGSVFLFSFYIFYSVYDRSDIIDHVIMALNDKYTANFLYFYIIQTLSFGNENLAKYIAITILSISVASKYMLTISYIQHKQKNIDEKLILKLSLLLLLIAPYFLAHLLANGYAYLGTFTPNVWHNSTTIAVFPFALLLFIKTANILESNTKNKKDYLCILILGVINILIKPSFILAYIVCLPIFSLFLRNRSIILTLISTFFLLLVIILKESIYTNQDTNKIEILPFVVYGNFIQPNGDLLIWVIWFVYSFFISLAFPIFVLLRNPLAIKNIPLLFSWALFIVSLLAYLIFAETGSRKFHSNFSWGTVLSAFMIFIVSAKISFNDLTSNIRGTFFFNPYQWFFIVHCIFGIAYVLKVIFSSYA